MTTDEQEELRLMQDIYDQCPLIAVELFHTQATNATLGLRFMHLKQILMHEAMEAHEKWTHEAVAIMAKQICEKIDADIVRELYGMNLSTASSVKEIVKLLDPNNTIEVEDKYEIVDTSFNH